MRTRRLPLKGRAERASPNSGTDAGAIAKPDLMKSASFPKAPVTPLCRPVRMPTRSNPSRAWNATAPKAARDCEEARLPAPGWPLIEVAPRSGKFHVGSPETAGKEQPWM